MTLEHTIEHNRCIDRFMNNIYNKDNNIAPSAVPWYKYRNQAI